MDSWIVATLSTNGDSNRKVKPGFTTNAGVDLTLAKPVIYTTSS